MARPGRRPAAAGQHGVGMVFLPKEPPRGYLRVRDRARHQGRGPGAARLARRARGPRRPAASRPSADRAGHPAGVRRPRQGVTVTDAPERKLYIIRKSAAHAIQALKLAHGKEFYVPSMSARTVVYKGMLLAHQVGTYYPRPAGRARRVGARPVHQRFSTNTARLGPRASVPADRAQRRDQHAAAERQLDPRARGATSPILERDLDKVWPIIYDGQRFGLVRQLLELLVMSGYTVSHTP